MGEQAHTFDKWRERRPGEVCGGEAESIHAAHIAAERPGITSLARERLRLPDDWQAVIWTREGEHPDYWGMSVEGGVCPPKTRGKYKGAPNWRAATLKRKFSATDAEVKAHIAKWERRTGKCEQCVGTGWRSFGWGCEVGHRYVPCTRCGWTGSFSEVLARAAIQRATGGES